MKNYENETGIKNLLQKNGYIITKEERSGNDNAIVFRLINGCIVNCWDTGKITCQGKNTSDVQKLINTYLSYDSNNIIKNNKVFVVYGHDEYARTQLEALLRRWDLEPLILDQLVSQGQTIIEKLEEFIPQASFAIVLATPDDIGYAKNDESNKKYRVRQNVVLELGMLLSKIGRKKVAILLSQAENMEPPSDINGLIYIPFKNNIEEGAIYLAKELDRNGYNIDIEKL